LPRAGPRPAFAPRNASGREAARRNARDTLFAQATIAGHRVSAGPWIPRRERPAPQPLR